MTKRHVLGIAASTCLAMVLVVTAEFITQEKNSPTRPDSDRNLRSSGITSEPSSAKINDIVCGTESRKSFDGKCAVADDSAENESEAASLPPQSTKRKRVEGEKPGWYEGSLNGFGQRHGHGVMRYDDGKMYDGKMYDGDFINDVREGWGKFSLSNGGGVYEGDFVNDKRHGTGRFVSPDGEYNGEWYEDKMHGTGQLHEPNGIVYSGQWVEGIPHGRGEKTFSDGIVFDGIWIDGVEQRGIYRHVDGQVEICHSLLQGSSKGPLSSECILWSSELRATNRRFNGHTSAEMPIDEAFLIARELGRTDMLPMTSRWITNNPSGQEVEICRALSNQRSETVFKECTVLPYDRGTIYRQIKGRAQELISMADALLVARELGYTDMLNIILN